MLQVCNPITETKILLDYIRKFNFGKQLSGFLETEIKGMQTDVCETSAVLL